MDGKVIGMNSFTREGQNMGFAIPSNYLAEVINNIFSCSHENHSLSSIENIKPRYID